MLRRSALRSLFSSSCAALFLISAGSAAPTPPRPGVGDHFDELVAGKRVFHDATVREVTARSIAIRHADGLASVSLRELSPELQTHFGYDPAAEQASATLALAQPRNASRASFSRVEERHEIDLPAQLFTFLKGRFGTEPEIRSDLDLRPGFHELSLGVKNQTLRPSCAVFAIVSTLEYQNARQTGKTEKLSEEYLIWATRQTIRQGSFSSPASSEGDSLEAPDAGFTLGEVIAAIRSRGLPPQRALPNTFGSRTDSIPEPPAEAVALALERRRVSTLMIPGNSSQERIANIIHCLNSGTPVVAGLRWPNKQTLRSGFLSEQQPMSGYTHAVALVGYICGSGKLEDTIFLFKNSYGPAWGEGGYGRVTTAYLSAHMLDALLVEPDWSGAGT